MAQETLYQNYGIEESDLHPPDHYELSGWQGMAQIGFKAIRLKLGICSEISEPWSSTKIEHQGYGIRLVNCGV